VKTVAPLLAAGTTFAATVVAGLFAGTWLDQRLGTSYWVIVLFFAGFILGIYGAWRLVARSLSP
jgi:F0F1-type ATP synthase assembly protein I